MNLEKNISILLYKHDCVIVPEFGAFILQKSNAGYDAGSSTFSPPKKQIAFNSSLTKNDGLLIQEVSQLNQISFEKAKEEVESTVEFWKNHLETNATLYLPLLGTLTKNENNLLSFQPVDANFLLNSYGLESLKAQRILPLETEQGSSTVWWKVAAVIPILLGGYLYFGKPQPVADFVNEQWSGFVSPLMDPSIVADKAMESLVKSKHSEATVIFENKYQVFDYQVISGAFRFEDEANAQVEKLHSKGYEKASLTQKKGKFFYVAFDTFSTKEEALVYRKILADEYPETWVLSLKE